MAKLVYGLNQSLDGYVDHLEFRPSPARFRHFIEHMRDQHRWFIYSAAIAKPLEIKALCLSGAAHVRKWRLVIAPRTECELLRYLGVCFRACFQNGATPRAI
jgi:hypothetical protein